VGQEKRELLANTLVKSALCHQVIGRIPSSDSERLNNEGVKRGAIRPFIGLDSTQIQPDGGTVGLWSQTARHGPPSR